MKIAILEADHVVEELAQVYGNYPHMFQALLLKQNSEIEFTTFTVIDDEFPCDEELSSFDGFLLTGSKFSAYDQEPWIERLSQLIIKLHNLSIPLVGICFGHQLIAQALGGKTEKNPNGWGVGVATAKLHKKPNWMGEMPSANQFNLLVSHQDQVMEIPKDGELLGGSEFCPNAMYQIGDNILTFQGHPEFTKPYCQALMERREEILGEETFSSGIASLSQEEHGDLIASWIVKFLST